MKMRYLAAALLLLGTAPANADAINNLSLSIIPDPDIVPQSQSNPCIICATNQAHNPPTFGYNNFVSNGSTDTFNMFSTNLFTTLGDGVQGEAYTRAQLRAIFNPNNLPVELRFAVAVDINTTQAKSEFLDFFQLIDLGGPGLGDETVIFDLRNIALPGIHNGNGEADYLITGFDLSGIPDDARLLFRAAWHGAVDGGESFYLVPQLVAVPGPMAGAGIPGLLMACAGLVALVRRRRRQAAA